MAFRSPGEWASLILFAIALIVAIRAWVEGRK